MIVCFGEVLWDMLPSGKIAGGAPMNVAYHLTQLGHPTTMISRIGQDDLGAELMDFLHQKSIESALVQVDKQLPTSTVAVTLNDKGQPRYEIVGPVAWDNIQCTKQNQKAVTESQLLVFGSLAARSEITRQTLFQLLEKAKFKVFDVNLRPPFYNRNLLEHLLRQADIVKMNDEELEIISSWHGEQLREQEALKIILATYELQGIIMTKGADGAVYLNHTDYFEQLGFSVTVQDTIGSGDAFLAGFISQLMAGKTPVEQLEFACATGAYVATQKGGTPHNSKAIVEEFIKRK